MVELIHLYICSNRQFMWIAHFEMIMIVFKCEFKLTSDQYHQRVKFCRLYILTSHDFFLSILPQFNLSSQIFAIKKIDFTKANTKELEHLSREESILRNLCNTKHENIVRYVTSFKTDSVLYIVTELCAGGSLYDYLRQVKIGLEEHEFKTYLEQILNGVKVHL